jgi:hypothetical protein
LAGRPKPPAVDTGAATPDSQAATDRFVGRPAIRSLCRSAPTDNGRENRMAFTFKLVQEDGTPADPPTLKTAVPT